MTTVTNFWAHLHPEPVGWSRESLLWWRGGPVFQRPGQTWPGQPTAQNENERP